MRTPEQVKWDYVQEWLKKAEQDLRASKVLEKADQKDIEVIAFHCQQSVEKFIKAVLVYKQIEFSKTHDIELIRTLLKPSAPELAGQLSIADWLSPKAVEYRYPGLYTEISPEEAGQLMSCVEEVRRIVLEYLAQYHNPAVSE